MMRIYLGHGAAGSAATMAPWVDGLRERGYEAHALTLPRRKAEHAIAAFEEQVPDEPGRGRGGHSFGGRVASLSAAGIGRAEGGARAARATRPSCASRYPLHRPGAPETAAARTAHWPRIALPGAAAVGDLGPVRRGSTCWRRRCRCWPDGRLVTWPKLGHGLLPVRDDALDRIAAFLARWRRRPAREACGAAAAAQPNGKRR